MKLKECFSINNRNDFIKGFYIDKKVCDNLISFFEKNKKFHVDGKAGESLDYKTKKSTDLSLYINHPKKEVKEYSNELQKCLNIYKNFFNSLDNFGSYWGIVESVNIQKYKPGEAFYSWHSERDGDKLSIKRLLVFMTYLNDVKDEGETEWLYQKLKIKPKKGLTVIWPADWMYTHKGCPSKTETKYIITGWYSFIDNGK
jgi:hypothetical protein